jgi:multidrug resistance efflux pump
VIGLGRIEPELRILDLNAEVSGIITRLPFRPGDRVAQGETIVELNQSIEQSKVEQAAALVETQASSIKSAKAALTSTRVKAANAMLSLERAKSLFDQKIQAQSVYDDAKAQYDSLVADTARLEADVATAESQLKQNRADLRYAQAVLSQRSIKAPAAGQVLSLDVTLGSLVTPGKNFGTFAPDSPLVARCEIDEMFASEVRLGQKAYVRNQGQTEALAQGTVSFVGPSLRKKSLFAEEVGDLEDRRVREVWLKLDAGSRLLFGSRVEGVILIGGLER